MGERRRIRLSHNHRRRTLGRGPARSVPSGVIADREWRCLKLEGPLELDVTGVLAALLVPLGDAGIAVFPAATHQTDYIFLKEKDLAEAMEVLRAKGHEIS